MISNTLHTIYRIISSRRFFLIIVGLLFIQAAWFALTVQYPIAFDESYHVGIIQFYSHQWLPFFTDQPAQSEAFGDLTRYGSYLFHYLMSFPYRLLDMLPDSFWVEKIIALRFINIGLFVGGLFLFRRLFRRIHLSEPVINFSLLMFVLVPLTPFLAATINYDNLAFLLFALFLNLIVKASVSIKEKMVLPASTFIFVITVGVFGSLVKYAFLPIFFAGLLYLCIVWLRSPTKKKILISIWHTFKKQRRRIQIVTGILLILCLGLFTERYGVNAIVYHKLEPACEDVRSVTECIRYGPWARGYYRTLEVANTNPDFDPPVQYFIPVWTDTMMYRMYFAINYDFSEHDPLPLPYYTAWFIGLGGLLLCLIFWRSILKIDRHLLLFALVIGLYLASILYVNINGYFRYRTVDFAVNGRYLIIILPLLFVWLGLAIRHFATKTLGKNARNGLISLAIVVLVLTLNGGGAQTYLIRSQPIWFWQDSPAPAINSSLKNILSPFIVDKQTK